MGKGSTSVGSGEGNFRDFLGKEIIISDEGSKSVAKSEDRKELRADLGQKYRGYPAKSATKRERYR